MIVGMGLDLVEIDRVEHMIESLGDRMYARLFSESEAGYIRNKPLPAQHAAVRLAAKEAAFKALRTGWRDGLSWHHVEVASDELGAPLLQLSGHARDLFEQLGATHAHLSLSHTSEHAVAQVIFERR